MTSETWQNWAGNVTFTPARVVYPDTVSEASELISVAAEEGLHVKCVGAAHSFTPAAATSGMLVSLDHLTGIESISTLTDEDGGALGADVTVWAGTRLHQLGPLLWDLGLSQPNLGDFAEQSIAGAISTGTHGTGAQFGAIPTTVVGLQVVVADGSVTNCSAEQNGDLFQACRLGVGALGIITKVTIRCVPAFAIHAHEYPWTLSAAVHDFSAFMHSNDHVEFYWFPHTDKIVVKSNTRLPGQTALAPVSRLHAAISDELLPNEVFDIVCRTGASRPSLVPHLNRISSKALSRRTYTDRSYAVFASARRVRFREMEYAVPVDAAPDILRQLQHFMDRSGVVSPFPVEVRIAAADDVWLSTAFGREVCYIAVHQFHTMDHTEYFRFAEQQFLGAGGRPHWGKMHSLGAAELHDAVPKMSDFVKVRDLIDPHRRFANHYTERIFG